MRKYVVFALISIILIGCITQSPKTTPSVDLIPTANPTAEPIPTVNSTTEPIPILTTKPTSVQTSPIQRIPVLLLQDGAPDDITAAMYLMLDPQVALTGVVVSNGETRPSRALAKWEDYIYAYMQWIDVQVVAGCDCAVDPHPNAFPDSWRDGADSFWGISLPEYTGQSNATSGADLVINLSNQYPGELVVVVTGPHTDLALALKKDPSILQRIKKVVIMGGAVDVPGNIKVDDPTQSNTTAEWNIWVDPMAAATVFSSGIPLDIIPMDPVPDVELNRDFAEKVGEVNLPGANLMSSMWITEFGWYSSDHIWIYDALAAIAVDHPENYTWISAPITVIDVMGLDQGRTVKGDGTSDHIRYARHADEQKVLDTLYSVFSPQAGTTSTPAPIQANTGTIAGIWGGTITNIAGTFSTPLKLSIQAGCKPGNVCGTFSVPQLTCAGDLYLQTISDEVFLFLEQNVTGSATCNSSGYEQLQLQADGTLSYHYLTSPLSEVTSSGILKNQ